MNFLAILLILTLIAKIESGGIVFESDGSSFTYSVISSEINTESSTPSASGSIESSNSIEQSSSQLSVADIASPVFDSLEDAYSNYQEQTAEIQSELNGNLTIATTIAEELVLKCKNNETLKPIAGEVNKIVTQLSATPTGLGRRRKRQATSSNTISCENIDEKIATTNDYKSLANNDLSSIELITLKTKSQIESMSVCLDNNEPILPLGLSIGIGTLIKSLNAILAVETRAAELADAVVQSANTATDVLSAYKSEYCESSPNFTTLPPPPAFNCTPIVVQIQDLINASNANFTRANSEAVATLNSLPQTIKSTDDFDTTVRNTLEHLDNAQITILEKISTDIAVQLNFDPTTWANMENPTDNELCAYEALQAAFDNAQPGRINAYNLAFNLYDPNDTGVFSLQS